MTRLINGFLCIVCLMLAACATQTSLSEEFDRSVKAYNRMLRWHEIESAGMTYIDPELRDEYLKQAESLKKRGLSFTDFRILSARYVPEKKTGDAVAEFDYYLLPSNRVKTVSYRQAWVYTESSKKWKLMSGLPDFE
ncbi:MAG: hypothetical protein PHP95_09180 [Desulfuromonadaceae bacterium]|nr:hypothetical protein [Desulfuromonadaceae bacterium]MDD2848616.1 hypothetical protein [Desulfuromonadaceae bacterium]